MTDIMSQDEMDALLAEVAGEAAGAQTAQPIIIDGDEVRARIHDFRRPMFLPSTAESHVKGLFASACDDIEVLLGAQTGMTLDRDGIQTVQLSCGEFLRSVTAPTLFSLVDVDPLPGPMVIELMPNLACALVDRLAGGEIRDVSADTGITAADARAAISPLALIAGALCDNLDYGTLVPRVKAIYSDPMEAAPCNDDEMGLLVSIGATIEYVEGIISVLLPRIFFWPVFESLRDTDGKGPAQTIPVIDFPLKARTASFSRLRTVGPSGRLEIDASARPRADMNAPVRGI